MEIEAELEMPEAVEETPDIEEVQDEPVEETSNDIDNDTQEETENKESISETEENEEKPSDMEEKENKDQDNKVETKEQKRLFLTDGLINVLITNLFLQVFLKIEKKKFL